MSDRSSRLREFGLSEYAARAYVALLDLGIAEARDVSSISKVPQAKIYHVLEQLHEKGLVSVLPEFPKKYAPVPFAEYLHRLHDEHARRASEIARDRDELAEIFRVVGDAEVADRGFFTVLRGRRNVHAKLAEIAQAARHSLLLVGTAGMLSRGEPVREAFAHARDRGVATRALAPMQRADLDALGALASVADLRAREVRDDDPSAKVAILVADAERAFIIHFVPDDESLVAGSDVGVLTDQEAMVAAIVAMLEPLWERATPFATRRYELLTGHTAGTTRVLASPAEAWRAIEAAVAAGARDVLHMAGGRAASLAPEGLALATQLRANGGAFRTISNFADLATLDAYAEHIAAFPLSDARHLSLHMVARFWLLDGREAYFSIAPAAGTETVIHTSEPAVVRALVESFEGAWRMAAPLAERRRELEIFPHLAPGDLGIGVLFNLLGDAVVVTDGSGRVVLWNPAAVQVFGYAVHDALGMDVSLLARPEHRHATRAWLDAQRARSGRLDPEAAIETQALRADGAVIDVEVMARAIEGSDGERFVLALARDVTARKTAAEQERQGRERIVRIYESMQEAFFSMDRSWRIVYMNPVAERMRKTPKEMVLGQTLWDAFPDLRGGRFDVEYHRAVREGVPVTVEEYYARMDRWFEARAFPSEEGLSVYYVDITERKRREAALAPRQA